jgi:hypothetical protein
MEQLNIVMHKQVLTFKMVEFYCLSKYRNGDNPLPDLRKWIADMGIELSVAYMETEVPISINKAVEWAGSKKRPMLIVHALKVSEYVVAVAIFMLEGNQASRPAKNYSIRTKPVCHHCKRMCTPVELDEATYGDIDTHGVQCLQEVDQFLYEGGTLCLECYRKEGGII